MEDIEGTRQRIASRIPERNVYLCVSMLVSDLIKFEQGEYYEELLDACEYVEYQEALDAWIDEADLSQLEDLVEVNGYWRDLIDELKAEGLIAQVNLRSDEDADDRWYLGDSFITALEDGCVFDDEDDAEEAALEAAIDEIREKVQAHVEDLCDDDQVELCNQFDVDLDDHRHEVYEHWAVSNWLARRLREHGHKVVGAYNMEIWCRGCTGQSISMDGVIRSIAAATWPEEWSDAGRNKS